MYTNIGKTIKTLAQISAWIGTIGSVIAGIVISCTGAAGLGMLIFFLGPFLSWLSAIPTYGFGELVEKTTEAAESLSILEQATGKEHSKLQTCELCQKKTPELFTVKIHEEEMDVCRECLITYSKEEEI